MQPARTPSAPKSVAAASARLCPEALISPLCCIVLPQLRQASSPAASCCPQLRWLWGACVVQHSIWRLVPSWTCSCALAGTEPM